MNLERLHDFFPADELEWKPIAVSKKTGQALAAAYVTNRAIMDRLDQACGPTNWRNAFQPGPNGGIICGLSIRVTHADGQTEWVTKWDGAENTDIEPVKGGLSGSMRRAAVQWGIGRYLYSLPQQWVPVNERGHFTKQPDVPRRFLPQQQHDPRARAAQRNDKPDQAGAFVRCGLLTPGERLVAIELATGQAYDRIDDVSGRHYAQTRTVLNNLRAWVEQDLQGYSDDVIARQCGAVVEWCQSSAMLLDSPAKAWRLYKQAREQNRATEQQAAEGA